MIGKKVNFIDEKEVQREALVIKQDGDFLDIVWVNEKGETILERGVPHASKRATETQERKVTFKRYNNRQVKVTDTLALGRFWFK